MPDPTVPRKRLTRQESQARTRALLLEVAQTEFLANGYNNTSLERVAESAGFSKGAVYGNFPGGKEELWLAVLENHFFGQLQQFVIEFAAGGATIENGMGGMKRCVEVLLT